LLRIQIVFFIWTENLGNKKYKETYFGLTKDLLRFILLVIFFIIINYSLPFIIEYMNISKSKSKNVSKVHTVNLLL
jgi:hypothetical protein